jgi:hypothetical protein
MRYAMRHENRTPANRRRFAAYYTMHVIPVVGVLGALGLAAWGLAKHHDKYKVPRFKDPR